MIEHLPDFLRAIVSTVMNVILMISLMQPKYSKKITRLALLGVLAADLTVAVYCYLNGNLTLLAKLDVILFTLLCFAVKPLFKDTFMQWLFSYITVQNLNLIVVVLSFIGSRYLPYPVYANTVLRLLMFCLIIYILRCKIRPLYQEIVEHWNIFFYVAIAIFINYIYYIISSEDIVATLTEMAIPLLLLTALSIAAYISVFHSMKNITREYALKREGEILRISASNMKKRISLMDDKVKQMSIAAHDRRHFIVTLLDLLNQGENKKAMDLLNSQAAVLPLKPRKFCENVTINAAVSFYVGLALEEGIRTDIQLNIPQELSVDELELSMVISNLLENAIIATQKSSQSIGRYIKFTAIYTGQLIFEMENPYDGIIETDKNGYPVSNEHGHGMGTQSIASFIEKYNAEILYDVFNQIFRVRIIV